MRAWVPERRTAVPTYTGGGRIPAGAGSEILQPLTNLAEGSDYLIAGAVGGFASGGGEFQIPRFIFMGPKGGGDTIRLGLFATLRGDDPGGAEALVEFFQAIDRTPDVARGFHVYAYPVCNPAGFAAGTRHNGADRDLIGEFWRTSREPEAYYLEREMGVHGFQGVITIHTVKDSSRFFINSRSSILDVALAQPALHVTREFTPIGGLSAAVTGRLIPTGFLTATDELRPIPFELSLGLPGGVSAPARVRGTVAALQSILDSYRTLISQRQDL